MSDDRFNTRAGGEQQGDELLARGRQMGRDTLAGGTFAPASWSEYARKTDPALLAGSRSQPTRALTYICGPTGFVESVAGGRVERGHEPSRIRTERFGPTEA